MVSTFQHIIFKKPESQIYRLQCERKT